MSHSKEKNSKKSGFEKKQVNGKVNPKYIDLLEEDKAISGQKFVCVSRKTNFLFWRIPKEVGF